MPRPTAAGSSIAPAADPWPAHWTPRAERLFFLALGLVLLLGCALRVTSLGRSLYLDEAWVINSVRTARVMDMLFYKDWVQTTPPLYLLLLRPLAPVADSHPEYFRMLSVAAGIAMLLAFYPLARRFLERPYALAALLLLACSPGLILYSQSAKQYATDALSCILALHACFWLGTAPSIRRLWAWTAAMIVLFSLSFTTVFLLPAPILGLALARTGSAARPAAANAWQLLAAVTALAAAVVVMHVGYVTPNSGLGPLNDYWRSHGGFVTSQEAFQVWFRYGVLGAVFGPLPFFVNIPQWQLGLSFLAIVGAAGLSTRKATALPPNAGSSGFALLVLPFVALAATNALGLYPVAATRLMVFTYPITAILLLCGAQTLCRVAAGLAGTRPGLAHRLGWASVIVIVLLTGNVVTAGMLNGRPRLAPVLPYENSIAAFRHLEGSMLPGDSLYLQAYELPQFHTYAPRFSAAPAVYEGRAGMVCCAPMASAARPSAAIDVASEIGQVVAQSRGRRVWALFGLPYLESSAAVVPYEQAFAAHACVRQGRWTFGRAVLYRWACSPAAPPGAAHAVTTVTETR